MKSVGIVLMLLGLAGAAVAGGASVPEISPASGVAALAMVSGALLVVRGRRRR